MLSIMTDDENNPEHAENVGLFYLRRIDARLDSIERNRQCAPARLARGADDADELPSRDMQRHLAQRRRCVDPVTEGDVPPRRAR